MWHLGTIEGTGVLFAGPLRVGTAEYEIIVSQDGGGMKTAHGTISGKWEALRKIYEAGDNATLRLKDGDKISILVTDLFEDRAEITVSGPVPDF